MTALALYEEVMNYTAQSRSIILTGARSQMGRFLAKLFIDRAKEDFTIVKIVRGQGQKDINNEGNVRILTLQSESSAFNDDLA